MHQELSHWPSVKIRDIAKTQSGGTPSTAKSEYWDGDIPWINSGKLKDGIITKPSRYITKLGLKESSAKVFPKNTVVIALTGSTTGKVGVLGIESSVNQSITGIFPNDSFDSKYIYYQLIFLRKDILKKALGTAQPHINKEIVDNLQLSLAPLNEQKLIVGKLDDAFKNLETIRIKLDSISNLLKKLRETALSSIVPNDPNDFVPLGSLKISIQTGPFGSALHKKDYIEKGVPVINPSHIRNGQIKPDDKVTISSQKAHDLRTWILRDGDVVLGRRGEMGRAASYEKKMGAMLCGTGSLILRCHDDISSTFLQFYLQSPFCVNYLTNNSVGSTMVNLNQNILKALPFPNLSKTEQEKKITKLEALFIRNSMIESRISDLKKQIEKLPFSLLNQAFNGKLLVSTN